MIFSQDFCPGPICTVPTFAGRDRAGRQRGRCADVREWHLRALGREIHGGTRARRPVVQRSNHRPILTTDPDSGQRQDETGRRPTKCSCRLLILRSSMRLGNTTIGERR